MTMAYLDIFNTFWHYGQDYIMAGLVLFFVMILAIVVYRIIRAYRESRRYFG